MLSFAYILKIFVEAEDFVCQRLVAELVMWSQQAVVEYLPKGHAEAEDITFDRVHSIDQGLGGRPAEGHTDATAVAGVAIITDVGGNQRGNVGDLHLQGLHVDDTIAAGDGPMHVAKCFEVTHTTGHLLSNVQQRRKALGKEI